MTESAFREVAAGHSNTLSRVDPLRRMHLDGTLIVALLALAAIGLAVLYSASGQDLDTVVRQALRFGLAFAVMVAAAQVPPHQLLRWTPWVYAVGCGMLVAVLYFGETGKGAQRWLDAGLFRFQPSEIMKIAVPMMIAWFLHTRELPPRLMHVLVAVVIMAVPVALVIQQPDLGTALLIGCAGFFVLFLAGLRWRIIAALAAGLAALAPTLWYMLHDYQRSRVLTFLNPESDPLGAGYHIIQSKIAIGSGGPYGKGWLHGTQSHLEFIPERATDFVFAVYSEEFGLTGVLVLIALYCVVVGRGLFIALHAQDMFGRLVASGISLTFFIYVFVNMGMVVGLLPVVGLPLPLISYGGTAIVTLMAGFGILMSIHTHRRLLSA